MGTIVLFFCTNDVERFEKVVTSKCDVPSNTVAK